MNEQPTSPGTRIVEPRDCIEELLKFTLESHIKGTLEIDLGLPTDFCSNLLLNHLELDSTYCIHGDTPYPLYRHLALSLYEAIICGGFCGTRNQSALFNEDNDLMEKREWDELVVHQGSELLNILKAVDFELHVQEPFFTQLKDGLKTIEGRCAVGHYNRIGSGALVVFNKCVIFEVKEVNWYASFFDMLEAESLGKVLPGVKTIEEGDNLLSYWEYGAIFQKLRYNLSMFQVQHIKAKKKNNKIRPYDENALDSRYNLKIMKTIKGSKRKKDNMTSNNMKIGQCWLFSRYSGWKGMEEIFDRVRGEAFALLSDWNFYSVQVYRTFYSEGKERSNGVLAISITKSTAQPYIALAKLLSGLSYRGIESLLGHTRTARTSTSLSQFNSDLSMSVFPCDPNVRL